MFIEANIYDSQGTQTLGRFIHESEQGKTHFILRDVFGNEHRMMLGALDVDAMRKFIDAVSKTPHSKLTSKIRLV